MPFEEHFVIYFGIWRIKHNTYIFNVMFTTCTYHIFKIYFGTYFFWTYVFKELSLGLASVWKFWHWSGTIDVDQLKPGVTKFGPGGLASCRAVYINTNLVPYWHFVQTDPAFWEPETATFWNWVLEWINLRMTPMRFCVYSQSVILYDTATSCNSNSNNNMNKQWTAVFLLTNINTD